MTSLDEVSSGTQRPQTDLSPAQQINCTYVKPREILLKSVRWVILSLYKELSNLERCL